MGFGCRVESRLAEDLLAFDYLYGSSLCSEPFAPGWQMLAGERIFLLQAAAIQFVCRCFRQAKTRSLKL